MKAVETRRTPGNPAGERWLLDEAVIRRAQEFERFLIAQLPRFSLNRFSPRTGEPRDTNYPLDAVGRMKAIQATRRKLFEWGGKGAVALGVAAAGVDQGARLPEILNPEPPEIVFPPSQTELLAKEAETTKTAVIFFGAATVQDPSKFPAFDKFIPPYNESGFPVGYMKYPTYGLDPKRTAEELKRLKSEHGIENVIGIFQSAAPQFMAEAFDLAGEDIKLLHGVFDSTPLDASTTDYPLLGTLTRIIDPFYDGGEMFPALGNYVTYGNILQGGTAGPDLAFDQSVALAEGAYLMSLYRKRIARDGTTFSYLTTADPNNDQVIDPVASLQGLERVLGVPIKRYGLKGHQHHANAHENAEEYQGASREIAKLQRSRLALAA